MSCRWMRRLGTRSSKDADGDVERSASEASVAATAVDTQDREEAGGPPLAPAEHGARAVSLHIYLPECFVIGTVYSALDRLIDFLELSSSHLYLHRLMWVPYRETASAVQRAEAVVPKNEVLFIVQRGEANQSPAIGTTEGMREIDVVTGPFHLRGFAHLSAAGSLPSLIVGEQRFFQLHDVEIEGPLGAVFTERQVIVHAVRASLIAGA